MVKEAANTHIFEEHKFQVQKTIQKKQMHIMQIASLLTKETVPKLNMLQEENAGGLKRRGRLEAEFMEVRSCLLELILTCSFQSYPAPAPSLPIPKSRPPPNA